MRIGIIGASSQVGSSLAFYLKHFTEAEPVCFVRSAYSEVFFDITALEYSNVSLHDKEALKNAFKGLDAVIDCTYPSGQLYEIPESIEANLSSIFSALPEGCVFIYMSTIMAFGMPSEYKHVRHFAVPRSTYAYIKRKAEALVKQLSAKHHVKGYSFRLGQVHGFLQSVNSSYREKLRNRETAKLDGNPSDKVNIIFISTLADAIIQAVKGTIKPGLYSLVNNPQWTLEELYSFYKEYYGLDTVMLYEPQSIQKKTLKSSVFGIAKRYRPLFESYVLMRNRSLYKKIKGRFRVADVAQSISNTSSNGFIDFHLLGQNPGQLIEGAGNSWKEMLGIEKSIEFAYETCLEKFTQVKHGSHYEKSSVTNI